MGGWVGEWKGMEEGTDLDGGADAGLVRACPDEDVPLVVVVLLHGLGPRLLAAPNRAFLDCVGGWVGGLGGMEREEEEMTYPF